MQDVMPRLLETHAWLIEQALTHQTEGRHEQAAHYMTRAARHIEHIGRALGTDLSDGVKM